jgi:hypothetical protein
MHLLLGSSAADDAKLAMAAVKKHKTRMSPIFAN